MPLRRQPTRSPSRLAAALRKEQVRARTATRAAAEADGRYRLLLAQSQRMQAQLRAVAQQILAAQEEERRKISGELHDVVVQLLAGISVQLATLTTYRGGNGRNHNTQLNRVRRLVEKSIEAVHQFARDLRPAVLDDLGLVPALRSFIKSMRTARRLSVRITAFPQIERVAQDKRIMLFRVAQEALTNVVRHAHATQVHVRLRYRAGAVALEIADNGVSFDAARALSRHQRKRLGLLGMRERVEMAGGRFAIESCPGKGTLVRAIVPVEPQSEGELR